MLHFQQGMAGPAHDQERCRRQGDLQGGPPGDYIIKVIGFVEVSEINARKKAIRGYPVESRLFTEDF
jgi:hypothetical protein